MCQSSVFHFISCIIHEVCYRGITRWKGWKLLGECLSDSSATCLFSLWFLWWWEVLWSCRPAALNKHLENKKLFLKYFLISCCNFKLLVKLCAANLQIHEKDVEEMNEKNENANTLNEEPLITADQVCVEHKTNTHESFHGTQNGAKPKSC